MPPTRRPLGAPLLGCGGNCIAWTGDSYIVLQTSATAGHSVGATTLIDRDGMIVRQSVDFGPTEYAAIAANGSRVLLLNERLLWFMNRDGTGKVIGRLPQTTSGINPVLVTRPDGFTVFAVETVGGRSRLNRIRVANSGNVTSTVVDEWMASVNFSAAASDDSELLVWSTTAPVPPGNVGTARVTTEALLLDSAGASKGVVPIANGYSDRFLSGPVSAPSVAWDGHFFAVAHVTGLDPFGATLTATLVTPVGVLVAGSDTVVDRTTLVPDAAGLNSMFVATGHGEMLFWSVIRRTREGGAISLSSYRAFDSFYSIAHARNELIAETAAAQSEPSASSDGTTIAVVWCESKYAWRIAGQVVTSRGVAFPPVVLSDSTIAGNPKIASGGGVHMAVWQENELTRRIGFYFDVITYRIMARRMGADGTLLDPSPVVIEEGTYEMSQPRAGTFSPSVVWTGKVFAVAWTGSRGQLAMARISASGERLVQESRLGSDPEIKGSVRLIKVGENVLALYFSRRAGVPDVIDIRGVLINKDWLPSASVLFAPGYGQIDTEVAFDAEWNGQDVLVAWRLGEFSNSPGYLLTRRFSPAGTPVGEQLVQPVATAFIGDFIPDGNSWWHLGHAADGTPIAQRLNRELGIADTVTWSDSTDDVAGVLVPGNLLIVSARSEEQEPGSPAPRLVLQWIRSHARERIVRP